MSCEHEDLRRVSIRNLEQHAANHQALALHGIQSDPSHVMTQEEYDQLELARFLGISAALKREMAVNDRCEQTWFAAEDNQTEP